MLVTDSNLIRFTHRQCVTCQYTPVTCHSDYERDRRNTFSQVCRIIIQISIIKRMLSVSCKDCGARHVALHHRWLLIVTESKIQNRIFNGLP